MNESEHANPQPQVIQLTGRLTRHWVADDGANRSAIGVVANVEFLAAPRAAGPAEQAAAA